MIPNGIELQYKDGVDLLRGLYARIIEGRASQSSFIVKIAHVSMHFGPPTIFFGAMPLCP